MKHTNVLKSNNGASYTNHTCEREEELHVIGSTLIGWPCKGCELVCAFTYVCARRTQSQVARGIGTNERAFSSTVRSTRRAYRSRNLDRLNCSLDSDAKLTRPRGEVQANV